MLPRYDPGVADTGPLRRVADGPSRGALQAGWGTRGTASAAPGTMGEGPGMMGVEPGAVGVGPDAMGMRPDAMGILPGTVGTMNAPRRSTMPAVGITVAVLVAVWTAAFIAVFGLALVEVSPWAAVAVNIVAGGGAAPALWRHRRKNTVRWLVDGAVPGVVVGWVILIAGAV